MIWTFPLVFSSILYFLYLYKADKGGTMKLGTLLSRGINSELGPLWKVKVVRLSLAKAVIALVDGSLDGENVDERKKNKLVKANAAKLVRSLATIGYLTCENWEQVTVDPWMLKYFTLPVERRKSKKSALKMKMKRVRWDHIRQMWHHQKNQQVKQVVPIVRVFNVDVELCTSLVTTHLLIVRLTTKKGRSRRNA
jgi:hypothetical protein